MLMKKIIYFLLLVFCSISANAQFGTITFNQDTAVFMRRLKLLTVYPGNQSDSIITHKPNGNIGRITMNQLTPSFSNILGKPNSLSGYGIVDAYPLSGNPSGFISSAPVSSVFGRTGNVFGQSGDYNTSLVTENSNLYFTNSRARSSVSVIANSGITYNSTSGEFSIPSATYNNAPARTFNSSYRISLIRATRVSYTISISTVLSLLNLNSSGVVQLQISPDNTNWITINSAGITRTLAVSVSVGLNDVSLLNVQGEIPTGFYCRLASTVSGGASVTFSSGQEVTY